jgi:hypothetical protein
MNVLYFFLLLPNLLAVANGNLCKAHLLWYSTEPAHMKTRYKIAPQNPQS